MPPFLCLRAGARKPGGSVRLGGGSAPPRSRFRPPPPGGAGTSPSPKRPLSPLRITPILAATPFPSALAPVEPERCFSCRPQRDLCRPRQSAHRRRLDHHPAARQKTPSLAQEPSQRFPESGHRLRCLDLLRQQTLRSSWLWLARQRPPDRPGQAPADAPCPGSRSRVRLPPQAI